jgi:hypothetical protein
MFVAAWLIVSKQRDSHGHTVLDVNHAKRKIALFVQTPTALLLAT